MAKIQIAFYKKSSPTADWQDKIIAWWTHGLYSHVELIIDGYMYSTSPRDKHVRVKKHIYDETRWDYLEIEANVVEIMNFFNETKNRKYDWLGILGFVIPFADSEKRFFCSEWVTAALIVGNVRFLYPFKPGKTSPNRLYKLLQKGIKNV